jgi:phytoene synthase
MADNQSYKKSNFGSAFFFLSEAQKTALSAVYAFCRYADDIVDEDYPDAKARLAALRNEVELIFKGAPATDLGKVLSAALSGFKIPKKHFLDLIDGVERDLKTPVRFQTYADLKWYMHRVAAVVGLMCIEIFGYKNQKTHDFAVNLGYAVQLTNIARDIAQDAKINRVYIPAEDLEKFGVSEQDILSLKNTQKTDALVLFELQRAEEYYRKARRLLPAEDFKNMLAARAMGNIYYEILKKLQRSTCRICENKLKLSKLEKLFILFKTWREKP